MALKNVVIEVRHMIFSGSLPELNSYVGMYINDGWEVLEVRLIHSDFNNQMYTIFYVLKKDVKKPDVKLE